MCVAQTARRKRKNMRIDKRYARKRPLSTLIKREANFRAKRQIEAGRAAKKK